MVRELALRAAAVAQAVRGFSPVSLPGVAQCAVLDSFGGPHAIVIVAILSFVGGIVIVCSCCACGLLLECQIETEYGRRLDRTGSARGDPLEEHDVARALRAQPHVVTSLSGEEATPGQDLLWVLMPDGKLELIDAAATDAVHTHMISAEEKLSWRGSQATSDSGVRYGPVSGCGPNRKNTRPVRGSRVAVGASTLGGRPVHRRRDK